MLKSILVIMGIMVIAVMLSGCVMTLQSNIDVSGGLEKDAPITTLNELE